MSLHTVGSALVSPLSEPAGNIFTKAASSVLSLAACSTAPVVGPLASTMPLMARMAAAVCLRFSWRSLITSACASAMVAPPTIAPAASAPTIATTRVFLMDPSPLKTSRPSEVFARRHGICCRRLSQSEQGRRQTPITTACGRPARRTLDGREEGSSLGFAGAPVPLDARHPAGHFVFLRPRRRRLDEAPFLVRLRHPHLAAVPHRLGLRRQHDRALLPLRERPDRVVHLSQGSFDRSAHLRHRPQSRRRHHGVGADLRGAGPGGGRPVLR